MKKLVNAATPAPYPVLSEHYRNSRYLPPSQLQEDISKLQARSQLTTYNTNPVYV